MASPETPETLDRRPSDEEAALAIALDAGAGPQEEGESDVDIDVERADEASSYSAIGEAPRGVDMDLSRGTAAARARAALLQSLIEKRLLPPGQSEISGATIARIWLEGRRVKAEAVISREQLSELNESKPASSNLTVGVPPAAPADAREPNPIRERRVP